MVTTSIHYFCLSILMKMKLHKSSQMKYLQHMDGRYSLLNHIPHYHMLSFARDKIILCEYNKYKWINDTKIIYLSIEIWEPHHMYVDPNMTRDKIVFVWIACCEFEIMGQENILRKITLWLILLLHEWILFNLKFWITSSLYSI
jgi:hypothetical protein